MNRLTNEDRCRVVACLVEGNSIRSTVRITGVAKKTVARLGVELGEACERFADHTMRGESASLSALGTHRGTLSSEFTR